MAHSLVLLCHKCQSLPGLFHPLAHYFPGLDAHESDVVVAKRALDRLSKSARVYGVNEAMGPDKDILEGF